MPSEKHKARKVGAWTELERREVYDNPWIRVTESEVLNPNGGSGIYGVVHFKNLAIGVIPVDEKGYTWLVGQDRFPFEGKYTWEIVEGGGPIEEDPLESAKRELLEEVGLKAENWQLIQEMDLSNSATTERALIYLARGISHHQAQPDETEQLQIKRLPLEEAFDMVWEGLIVDSLSVAGLLKLRLMEQ